MDSACICLRSSSSRLTTSVSAEMANSSPFCRSSCWSMRSRSKSCSRPLVSGPKPEESGWRDSASNCSRLRRRSARVTMLLLMRAMISSTTVSSWSADWLDWAITRGAPRNIANRSTANFFIKYLIRWAYTREVSPRTKIAYSLELFYRVWPGCAGRQRRTQKYAALWSAVTQFKPNGPMSRKKRIEPKVFEDKEHTIASAGGVFKSRRQFKYHPLAVSTAGYGRSEEVAHSVESHSVIQVGSVWSRAKGVEYALIPSATSVGTEFESHATVASRVATRRGCSVEIPGCVEDQRTGRRTSVRAALKAIQHRVFPASDDARAGSHLEHGARSVGAAKVGGTVEIAVRVGDQATVGKSRVGLASEGIQRGQVPCTSRREQLEHGTGTVGAAQFGYAIDAAG